MIPRHHEPIVVTASAAERRQHCLDPPPSVAPPRRGPLEVVPGAGPPEPPEPPEPPSDGATVGRSHRRTERPPDVGSARSPAVATTRRSSLATGGFTTRWPLARLCTAAECERRHQMICSLLACIYSIPCPLGLGRRAQTRHTPAARTRRQPLMCAWHVTPPASRTGTQPVAPSRRTLTKTKCAVRTSRPDATARARYRGGRRHDPIRIAYCSVRWHT